MQILPATPTFTISMPTGTSSLPLVELDKNQVTAKGKQIRLRKNSQRRKASHCSFGNFKDRLDFKAIEFFHAAKKTELTRSFSHKELERQATAFATEYDDSFIWNTTNFRKTNRNIFSLTEFDSSRLAGRVGEAIAYLTMVKWDYVYWDRCTTIWQRAAQAAKIEHREQVKVAKYLKSKISSGKPDNEPDFVFEKSTREVALMEAKGGFVHPTYDDPSTKGDLAQALTQLTAWSRVISPAPSKSFGIGTYLREEGDSTGDPSLVAFVDPEGEPNINIPVVEIPSDLVRRCNYGAWLSGMGLVTAGRALRDLRSKVPEAVSLPVVRIMNREFAVTVLGWKVSLLDMLDTFFWWPDRLQYVDHISGILAVGLEVNTLEIVGSAIHHPTEPVLLRLDNQSLIPVRRENDNINWSLMPDGSCVLILDRESFRESIQEWRTFKI